MAVPDPTRPRRGLGLRLVWPVVIAGIAALAAAIVNDYATERDLVARRARLQLIWPDYLAIPDKDRELLDALAVHCHLAREPLALAPAVECLQRAASDAAFVAPGGINAAAELPRLLGKRSISSPALPVRAQLLT